RPFQRAKTITEIVENVLKPPRPTRIAAFLFAFADRTHRAHRGEPRLLRRETGFYSFIDLLFQVVFELFLKFFLDTFSADYGPQKNTKAIKPTPHLSSPLLYSAHGA